MGIMRNAGALWIVCGLVVGMSWFARAGLSGPAYDLSRHTVDGGGVMHSTGNAYELGGTIGQPDAGVMTGREYTLTGGFWFGLPPGDCSDDGLVNLLDHAVFQRCVRGPDVGPPEPECLCFDVDRNRVIDMRDVATVQSNYTGP